MLDWVQRRLARSRLAVAVAVKARNQVMAVIRHSRGPSIRPEENGEAWLVRKLAPTCSSFIDVGANVGDWTALFLASSQEGSRGLLFEPSPSALATLHSRFGSLPTLEIVPAAAGDSEGLVELHDHGAADQHATVVAASRGTICRAVPLVTLDGELRRRGWKSADFVKIDAEGYDFRVLEGARGLLQGQGAGVIQFEYSDLWRLTGSTLGYAIRFLEGYGYKTFLLTRRGLRDVEYGRFGEYYGYSNYVALSPARAEQVGRSPANVA